MHINDKGSDRIAGTIRDGADLEAQLAQLRESIDASFLLVNLRIDHVTGRHDHARYPGCPSCEVLRAA